MIPLLYELPLAAAERVPDAPALQSRGRSLDYQALALGVRRIADTLAGLGLPRAARVAVYSEKSHEAVQAMFGASLAGGVFVPINPGLKPGQVAYILRDCNVFALVTTASRLELLLAELEHCPDLAHVLVIGPETAATKLGSDTVPMDAGGKVAVHRLDELTAAAGERKLHRVIDTDMAAILYTSGSTGNPKGVVLSHRNMVAGAHSVASYLGNTREDRILAMLPLSFDYGFSQLTTAFSVGASVVLHDHLLAADTIKVLARERITGLAAVPPLWIQLTASDWPASIDEHLRYYTNSGGAMPSATLAAIRRRVPHALPYLMYGLTEAFRSTYLPPEEVDRRPTSIGKAIPNAEVLVVRADGVVCGPDEPGELVHRGTLVSLGYWNDPAKTAERFRPVPGQQAELVLQELAVWSGDTVKRDADGFLYFVGREDEMIKSSGYRISPTEIEEVVYRSGMVAEAAAFGVAHPALGQAVVLVAQPLPGSPADTDALVAACREWLPAFMLPTRVDWVEAALPRNANGKIDRKQLALERRGLFGAEP